MLREKSRWSSLCSVRCLYLAPYKSVSTIITFSAYTLFAGNGNLYNRGHRYDTLVCKHFLLFGLNVLGRDSVSEGQVILSEKGLVSGQWRENLTFQNRCVHGVGDDRCLYMWYGVNSEKEDWHIWLD